MCDEGAARVCWATGVRGRCVRACAARRDALCLGRARAEPALLPSRSHPDESAHRRAPTERRTYCILRPRFFYRLPSTRITSYTWRQTDRRTNTATRRVRLVGFSCALTAAPACTLSLCSIRSGRCLFFFAAAASSARSAARPVSVRLHKALFSLRHRHRHRHRRQRQRWIFFALRRFC